MGATGAHGGAATLSSPQSTADVLPDVLDHHLRIVFCGSAAGRRSAEVGEYYAGPGNRFWPTLCTIGLTDRPLTPHEFRQVLGYGIGLTDLAKREFGGDHELSKRADDVPGLKSRISRYRPRFLAFNGKRAAEATLARPVDLGLQPERIGSARVFVLPSTSGLASRYWSENPWCELAVLAKEPH